MKNVEPNLGSGMSDDTDHLLSIERGSGVCAAARAGTASQGLASGSAAIDEVHRHGAGY